MDDAALAARVARAQLGDLRALDDVLRAIQLPIHRHVSTIAGDDDRAWDVVQVTLLSIARTLGDLRDARLFRPWAFRIATRAAIKQLARDRREELFADPPDVVADEADAEDPRWDEISAHVKSLPPASRLVVEMHFLDGMKLWEIAEALEVPEGTAKSRLAYGLATLRRRLPFHR